MLEQVTEQDIEAIAIGAGILGTGGGGDPYLESLHLRHTIRERGPQQVLAPQALDNDARVVVVGYIGAPTVSIEKLPRGDELLRAIRLLERHLGRRMDAIGIAEIGGGNSLGPLVVGLQAGIPTVDADGMGRAFPEVQMSSYLLHNDVLVAPFAMAEARANGVVVPYTVNALWAERIARNLAVSMGATAGLAGFVMTGAQFKAYCIPHTLSLAHELGQRVLQARANDEDAPQAIAATLAGRILFRGKITDVYRRTTKGFARGTLMLQGYQGEAETLDIEFQNEFLIARLNGQVLATVPDLICIVTAEEGQPVATERLRYGTRVAVLGAPAAPQLKTPVALQVVGPQAFGYGVDFAPLPGQRIGVDIT
ncbi:MAG: DUF917 domain-containing protein [Caldilineaceae bacterium]